MDPDDAPMRRSPRAERRTWQPVCSSSGVKKTTTRRLEPARATTAEFYAETTWCAACRGYVRFLMSVDHSYCIACGGRVRLFSQNDRSRFGETVQRHKWQAS